MEIVVTLVYGTVLILFFVSILHQRNQRTRDREALRGAAEGLREQVEELGINVHNLESIIEDLRTNNSRSVEDVQSPQPFDWSWTELQYPPNALIPYLYEFLSHVRLGGPIHQAPETPSLFLRMMVMGGNEDCVYAGSATPRPALWQGLQEREWSSETEREDALLLTR